MAAQNTLLVFAHSDEAAAFENVPHLVTGVGKINAAVGLADVLAEGIIDRVVVLGTAGVVGDGDDRLDLDTIYQVTGFVQHDFELESPTIEPDAEVIVPAEHTTVMATGDQFVSDDSQRATISGLGAKLCDMEGYAYAAMCERFNVPLQVFKVPSDFADSSTTQDEWDQIVFHKSEQLRAFWDERFAA